MNRWKRKLGAAALMLGGAVLLWGCGGKKDPLDALRESGTLRVALAETGAPFAQSVNGQPEGIEPDLARLTADALGVQVEYHIMDREQALDAVISGEADLAMGGLTAENGRSKGCLSSVSYGKRFLYLVTKAGDYVNSASDLDGESVGVSGNVSQEALQELTVSGNIRIISFSDAGQAEESLNKGEIKGFFCYQEEAESYLDDSGMLVQNLPFLVWEEYCAQASPENSALISGLNVLIQQQAEETADSAEDSAEAGGGQ